jgi:D-alanine-D-alanine ligase
MNAEPPGRSGILDVAVVMGDPRLDDATKRNGQFNTEDFATINRLRQALATLPGYRFRFLDRHDSLLDDLRHHPPQLAFNLCDEGYENDPFHEAHVPAYMDLYGIPYTGAGPACLTACYDKSLVRAIALNLGIPVPREARLTPHDDVVAPSGFPVLVKPNFGDGSSGIDKGAVVHDQNALDAQVARLRASRPGLPVLVQEFLPGREFTIGLIGNPVDGDPRNGLQALPALEVDFSALAPDLPQILGYESKFIPGTSYWDDIRYPRARLDSDAETALGNHCRDLFAALRCQDYARFDFRTGADGTIRLLEVNPNPGWCWDGKLAMMAAFAGMDYPAMLQAILDAARTRLRLPPAPRPQSASLAISANGHH